MIHNHVAHLLLISDKFRYSKSDADVEHEAKSQIYFLW